MSAFALGLPKYRKKDNDEHNNSSSVSMNRFTTRTKFLRRCLGFVAFLFLVAVFMYNQQTPVPAPLRALNDASRYGGSVNVDNELYDTLSMNYIR